MEKLMYLLYKPNNTSPATLRDQLRKQFKAMEQLGASSIRLTISDEDVAPAKKLFIRNTQPSPDGVLSFWLNSAIALNRAPFEKLLENQCEHFHGYLVTESEPLINVKHAAEKGKRTYGMNQVVLLKKPAQLGVEQWIDTWHNSHTQIAIDTQSTFGYRQNVIARPVTNGALPIDAIVEENFPPEAMSSAHAFYKAIGDDALLKKHQTTMFESVQRFIDFGQLDCLPMSEYNA